MNIPCITFFPDHSQNIVKMDSTDSTCIGTATTHHFKRRVESDTTCIFLTQSHRSSPSPGSAVTCDRRRRHKFGTVLFMQKGMGSDAFGAWWWAWCPRPMSPPRLGTRFLCLRPRSSEIRRSDELFLPTRHAYLRYLLSLKLT